MKTLDLLQRQGLRRLGTPRRGFRYVRADGRPASRPDVERIRALRLPPAWTDVFVSAAPGAKVQAIGKDKAGRWQYRYHAEFSRRRAAAKYRRLLRFADALPQIRAQVERDLRKRGPSRERVLAGMVRILETCFMRPGSEAYLRNGSYGLTTVRPGHVRVAGDTVTFDYRGKSGQRQVRELTDRSVARLVRELLRVPGRDVFKFVEDGPIVDVRRRHLNAYIRVAAGAPFTAKDFRTWAGTLLCANELAHRERAIVHGRTSRKLVAAAAVRAVADRLGNTPAVARGSYVSPAVLDGFGAGKVLSCCFEPGKPIRASGPGLHEVERALVAFLREAAPRRPLPPKLRLVRGGGRGPTTPERTPRAPSAAAKPAARAARGPETG